MTFHDLAGDDDDGADSAGDRLQHFVAGLLFGCLQHCAPLTVEALENGTEFVHALQITNVANGVRLLVSIDLVPA